MFKKISFILLCAVASLSTPSYSMTHSLQRGVTIEYELPSHAPQLFINYMFWSVEATCKITSEDETIELFAEALAKKGKVNNITLSAGQTIKLSVHSGESIKLSADSGAKVQITNLNNHLVHTSCTSS